MSCFATYFYQYGWAAIQILVSLFHSIARAQTHMTGLKETLMRDHLKATRKIAIDNVYVPVKRKKSLEPTKVDAIAESIIDEGQKTPIQVRHDNGRLVLVEGLHRLEACRELGVDMINAIFVQARRF